MQQVRTTALVRPFFLAAFLLVCFHVAVGQNNRSIDTVSPENEPTLKALLNEMRLLRSTLERMNLQSYRIQTTLEQLRIEHEHIDRLARQLDEVRNQLVDIRQSREQKVERAKDLEEQLKLDPDGQGAKQIGPILKDVRFEIEQQIEKEQAKREREGQLASEIQTEQSKLDELNKRLETLESEMTSPKSAGSSQSQKPRP